MSAPAPLPDFSAASPGSPREAATDAQPRSRVWLWIVAIVGLQLAAWTAWLMIASQHRVAEVPLAPAAATDTP